MFRLIDSAWFEADADQVIRDLQKVGSAFDKTKRSSSVYMGRGRADASSFYAMG